MKLNRLDVATVSRAVSVYLNLAYGEGHRPPRVPDLSVSRDAGWQGVLGLFQREEAEEGGHGSVRYTFRLGNRNYPFMKLVLHEHLMPGEFVFAVDTHDEMDIKPDYPDYQAWLEVRRFNQALKRQIEARLTAEGLHTAATLCQIVEERPRSAGDNKKTILVVDDEADLGRAVEALLRARGYRVERAEEGDAAVRLTKELLPDLVILDYELPEMDGLEVIAALREDEATRDIPVLLQTAGRISLADIQRADGFLAKPFPEDLLYQLVERLLGGEPK